MAVIVKGHMTQICMQTPKCHISKHFDTVKWANLVRRNSLLPQNGPFILPFEMAILGM